MDAGSKRLLWAALGWSSTGKENKRHWFKKKGRKDRSFASWRGLMEKPLSSRLMPTGQFLFKEMC